MKSAIENKYIIIVIIRISCRPKGDTWKERKRAHCKCCKCCIEVFTVILHPPWEQNMQAFFLLSLFSALNRCENLGCTEGLQYNYMTWSQSWTRVQPILPNVFFLLHTSQITHTLFKRCPYLVQSLVSTQSIQYLTVANTQVTGIDQLCVHRQPLIREKGWSRGSFSWTVASNSISFFHVAIAYARWTLFNIHCSKHTRYRHTCLSPEFECGFTSWLHPEHTAPKWDCSVCRGGGVSWDHQTMLMLFWCTTLGKERPLDVDSGLIIVWISMSNTPGHQYEGL